MDEKPFEEIVDLKFNELYALMNKYRLYVKDSHDRFDKESMDIMITKLFAVKAEILKNHRNNRCISIQTRW